MRIHDQRLCELAEAVAPAWPGTIKPSPQVAVHVAACELGLRRGLLAVDLGGSVPSLQDGVLRNKRAWGGVFGPWRDSHRDILVRWRTPAHPAVIRFLRELALVFATPRGLAALLLPEPGDHRIQRRFRTPGIEPLIVAGCGPGGAGLDALDPKFDAAAVNRAAIADPGP
jgi:hypothetical protein